MFAVARRYRNVLDARVTPIVFLPGIMGSRLRLEGGSTAVDWDPDSSITTMLADWLHASAEEKANRLNANNPGEVLSSGNGLTAEQCSRGWAGVVSKFYLEMLEALESGLQSSMFRSPVYAFGYDWRQPNEKSANRLKERGRRRSRARSTSGNPCSARPRPTGAWSTG
jgi:hypothetical protein